MIHKMHCIIEHYNKQVPIILYYIQLQKAKRNNDDQYKAGKVDSQFLITRPHNFPLCNFEIRFYYVPVTLGTFFNSKLANKEI